MPVAVIVYVLHRFLQVCIPISKTVFFIDFININNNKWLFCAVAFDHISLTLRNFSSWRVFQGVEADFIQSYALWLSCCSYKDKDRDQTNWINKKKPEK